MPPAATGLHFTNQLSAADVARNQNLTLGSGVAAGDYDGDGRCDLYFCSITGRNALFRNLDAWKFEDVTAASGTSLAGTTNTGAAFTDLDGDGDLDLLVTSLGNGLRWLDNQGDGTFQDRTRQAGFHEATGALTLAIADVEGDGDLDVYVCNYGAMALLRSSEYLVRMVNGQLQVRGLNSDRIRIVDNRLVELGEADALFLNRGDGTFEKASWNSPRFLDAKGNPMAAPLDFGLSAQWRDVNQDGAPDLYVCNDFETRDRFWLNDGSGRFRAAPSTVTRVESYSSMGIDFSDIDRDGLWDFLVVEMLSPNLERRLSQKSPMQPARHEPGLFDQRAEVPRNTLFHARGDGTYEEIAHYAGVEASDWSWQGSFLDVDLDGWEDVLVVNGHEVDLLNLDSEANRAGFNQPKPDIDPADDRLLTPNLAWRNEGDLTFTDHASDWGFNDTNLCHGLVLADLDNDGDRDVIINRLHAPALLLRNEVAAPRLAVRLRGRSPNTEGIGARLVLRSEGAPPQTREVIAGGKYLSHDQTTHCFATPDFKNRSYHLEVTWRSGRHSFITNAQPGFLYDLTEPDSAPPDPPPKAPDMVPWFAEANDALAHRHIEPEFDDFARQPLLPRKLSQRGPGIAVMDINEDGHEDILIGTGQGGQVTGWLGDGQGEFTKLMTHDAAEEDILGLCAWADPDGHSVVLASSAVYEKPANPPTVPLWRYRKKGDQLATEPAAEATALYPRFAVSSCLTAADFDADGDLDVFLGAHALAGLYPLGGPSQLLRNEDGVLRLDRNNGPTLLNLGPVNSALWTDLNNDGWPELVVACDWGPIRVFRNDHGQLREFTQTSGLAKHTGWWTGLASADFNGDGRRDLVAGNWGWNSTYHATPERPLRLYYGDFMNRQVMDLLESEWPDEATGIRPSRSLSEVGAALPTLQLRFPTHRSWAQATMEKILAPLSQPGMIEARTLASTLFLNEGETFEARPLPRVAQMAPVWAVVSSDFNNDGHMDLFLSQNFYAPRPGQDRLDAGRGLVLRGDGQGGFQPLSGAESGLTIVGDQRGAAVGDFNEDGRPDLVVGQNGGPTKLYWNRAAKPGWRVRLRGPAPNPQAIGATVQFVHQNGTLEREIQSASGWLSQNSSVLTFPIPPSFGSNAVLRVRWPGGRMTTTPLATNATFVTIDMNGQLVPR